MKVPGVGEATRGALDQCKAVGVEPRVTRTVLEMLAEGVGFGTSVGSVCGSAGNTVGITDTGTQLLLNATPLTGPDGLKKPADSHT